MAIRIYCDGACSGNPGPGGWGTIVATPDGRVKELGGGNPATTNNQMEITAAISGLEHLRATPGEVWIFTDSTYLIQGITKWIWGWRQRNWQTADGKPVANRELWERLSSLILTRGKASPVKWNHVKGHAGHPANERVDAIAVAFS